MDLRHLKTFIAVAKHKHFQEAARSLFLSQPTVSKHIRLLEESLDCTLFERRGKRVSLTHIGERLYEDAVKLLDDASILEESVDAWRRGYRTRLSVAASPMIARTFLPHIIRRFARDCPDVELSILVTESVDIPVLLEQRRADLGLSRMPARAHADILAKLIYRDPVVMVAPPDGGDADSPIPNWEALIERLPVISHNHPGYWDPLLHQLRHRGLNVRSMRVSQIDISIGFIAHGLGVSFLPHSAVSDAVLVQRIRQVPAPDLQLPETATYVIAPRHGRRPEREAFIEILERHQLQPGYA